MGTICAHTRSIINSRAKGGRATTMERNSIFKKIFRKKCKEEQPIKDSEGEKENKSSKGKNKPNLVQLALF